MLPIHFKTRPIATAYPFPHNGGIKFFWWFILKVLPYFWTKNYNFSELKSYVSKKNIAYSFQTPSYSYGIPLFPQRRVKIFWWFILKVLRFFSFSHVWPDLYLRKNVVPNFLINTLLLYFLTISSNISQNPFTVMRLPVVFVMFR